jgi:hypothetical protein
MIFVIAGVAVLIIFLFGLFIRSHNRALSSEVHAAEKKMEATEKALNDFAAAIAEYAYHLSSHTGAIQGLAEASQELKKSAAFQNNVILNLIKNTEEALVRKEALLSTVKIEIPLAEKPAPRDTKPAWEKSKPSFRVLHPPKPADEPEKPTLEDKRTVFETANLVEAMVLPYYRALYRLEKESPASADEKSIARAKKAVEAIMFPFYRTLYQARPQNNPNPGRPIEQ